MTDDVFNKTKEWFDKSKQKCLDNPEAFYTEADSSIPEYISKYPLHWRISDQVAIGYTDDRTIIHGPELLRDMLFVPLDRQALREQLIELTDKFFGAGKWEYYDTNDENSFADQALRLFGLENTGEDAE